MFILPFSNPVLASLLGDEKIAEYFSDAKAIERLILFEKSLVRAFAETGQITSIARDIVIQALHSIDPDIDRLRMAIEQDGTAVPELLRAVRKFLPRTHHDALHIGATSQDLIDTALSLTLQDVNSEIELRLGAVSSTLQSLASKFGDSEIMGRTRMQDAQPIPFSERVSGWQLQFELHSKQLKSHRKSVEILQLGGPVGDRSSFGDKAASISVLMAKDLGLSEPGCAWHSQRSHLANYASWLTTLSTIAAKTGQDCVLMAQMGEIVFSSAGGSSAMPHKRNPVAAEILITLGRFNATLVSGMQHSVIHEQERSGSAWTLEWMILPQMCVAAGASLRKMIQMLNSIQSVGGN